MSARWRRIHRSSKRNTISVASSKPWVMPGKHFCAIGAPSLCDRTSRRPGSPKHYCLSNSASPRKAGEATSGVGKAQTTKPRGVPTRCLSGPVRQASVQKSSSGASRELAMRSWFAGWISAAIRTGSRCTLECDRRLQPLFARSFPEAVVLARPKAGSAFKPLAAYPDADISAHLPAGSMPGLFQRPAQRAYLVPDATKRQHFRDCYRRPDESRQDPYLLGLAWHSRGPRTGRRRSIALAAFAPVISACPQARWISLQYGEHSTLEAKIAAAHIPVHLDSSVDALLDVDTYAAQISALDLVITIDNATAHLAGALGVPVWLLLPFAADWRWLQARDDSPWYPSVRLLRQPKRGDWPSVLQQVERELRALHPTTAAPHSADAAPRGSPCSESWSSVS